MKARILAFGLVAAAAGAQLHGAAFEMDTQVLGPAPRAQFGIGVAVSEDTVAVGARYSPGVRGTIQTMAGSVYVYGRRSEGWVFQQRLVPNDLSRTYSPARDFGFGSAIAISAIPWQWPPRGGAMRKGAWAGFIFSRAMEDVGFSGRP